MVHALINLLADRRNYFKRGKRKSNEFHMLHEMKLEFTFEICLECVHPSSHIENYSFKTMALVYTFIPNRDLIFYRLFEKPWPGFSVWSFNLLHTLHS